MIHIKLSDEAVTYTHNPLDMLCIQHVVRSKGACAHQHVEQGNAAGPHIRSWGVLSFLDCDVLGRLVNVAVKGAV